MTEINKRIKENNLYMSQKHCLTFHQIFLLNNCIYVCFLGMLLLYIGMKNELYFYQPLSQILHNISDSQKEELCCKVRRDLERSDFTSISQLLKCKKSKNNCYNDIQDKLIACLALEYKVISKI